jgi:hypothetical protein
MRFLISALEGAVIRLGYQRWLPLARPSFTQWDHGEGLAPHPVAHIRAWSNVVAGRRQMARWWDS